MKLFIYIIMITSFCAFILFGCRSLFDSSEAPELLIQPPSEANNINVTEPVFGTICHPGDTLIIKWIAPTIQEIDIELFRKSDFKFVIDKNLENDGKYNWIIPLDIALSNHYLIKVVSHNNKNILKFSGQFGIL